MAVNIRHLLGGLLLLAMLTSCDSGPKVITSRKKASGNKPVETSSIDWLKSGSPAPKSSSFSDQVHQIVIQETLAAERYTYLKVVEKGEEFWIATRKGNFEVGTRYFYRDGLLKKNFHSKEHNRIFDRIYLVSKLVPEKHGGNKLQNPNPSKVAIETHSSAPGNEPSASPHIKRWNSISIAELIKDPAKFEGQIVELKGNCVKVNPNIMQRNWIHLKDGTADHFDLVVTTQSQVKEGVPLHVKARVVLNKDFGAGYSYELILEEGIIL